ncbi:MAG TPA: hypothetical protein PKX17_03775 [Candidatus Methanomethylicus sp.]|nr:hypothetical protein [Candidatus Methanomethylicus sp.]
MMADEKTTVHVDGQPFEVKLTRYAKGGYGWEISVKGGESKSILEAVGMIDWQLRKEFGATEGGGQ